MRRAVTILIVSVCVTASAMPVATAAGRRTAITADCRHAEVRPRSIVFACADMGSFVRRLDWSMWHAFKARASGVFHMNDCDPSCAGGTMHTAFGRLRVRNRLWCDDIGRYVFERALVRFPQPLLGRTVVRYRLNCPF